MGYFDDIQAVVRRIPKGRVCTYGHVAAAAGRAGAARQVAWALRDADRRGLPWHRVLGAAGRIRLPGEAGMRQRLLLELEGVPFRGGRVDLGRCGYALTPRTPVRRTSRRPAAAGGK